MEKDRKHAMISDFISLARADEKVTTAEYDFIIRLAQRMDVTNEEVDALFKNPVPSKPLFSEMERIIHFHKLVLLMNVDRETHEKEVVALRNFGLKMGIRTGAVDKILVEMNNYEDKIIPSQELIKIFQTYYN